MASGWKFWPEKEPGPVDDAYVQVRWIRPYRPGPLRVAATLLIAVFAIFTSFSGFLGALGAVTFAQGVFFTAVTLMVAGSLVVLASRLLSVGVWVNDRGVRVLGLVRRHEHPWSAVADVRRVPGRARVLGTPLRSSGTTVFLVLKDGSDLETPLTDVNADFAARAEAFDMAAGAVERWFEEARGPAT